MSKLRSIIRRVVNYILNGISIFNEFIYRNTGIGFNRIIGMFWRYDENFPRRRFITKTEELEAKKNLEAYFTSEQRNINKEVSSDIGARYNYSGRYNESLPRIRIVTRKEYLAAKRRQEENYKLDKEKLLNERGFDLAECFYQLELWKERKRREEAEKN